MDVGLVLYFNDDFPYICELMKLCEEPLVKSVERLVLEGLLKA